MRLQHEFLERIAERQFGTRFAGDLRANVIVRAGDNLARKAMLLGIEHVERHFDSERIRNIGQEFTHRREHFRVEPLAIERPDAPTLLHVLQIHADFLSIHAHACVMLCRIGFVTCEIDGSTMATNGNSSIA